MAARKPLTCYYGVEATRWVSKSSANPSQKREYYGCSILKGETCKFIAWADLDGARNLQPDDRYLIELQVENQSLQDNIRTLEMENAEMELAAQERNKDIQVLLQDMNVLKAELQLLNVENSHIHQSQMEMQQRNRRLQALINAGNATP